MDALLCDQEFWTGVHKAVTIDVDVGKGLSWMSFVWSSQYMIEYSKVSNALIKIRSRNCTAKTFFV